MSEQSDFKTPRFIRDLMLSLVTVTCPQEPYTDDVRAQVVDDADRFLRTLPAPFRLGLTAGMTAYDVLAAAVPGNLGKRASQLPPDRARKYYDLWAKGPLGVARLFAFGVKGIIAGAYYEQDAVRQDLGYTPDEWIDKVAKKRLQVYSEDVQRHEDSIFAPDPLPLRDGSHAPSAPVHLEEAS